MTSVLVWNIDDADDADDDDDDIQISIANMMTIKCNRQQDTQTQ